MNLRLSLEEQHLQEIKNEDVAHVKLDEENKVKEAFPAEVKDEIIAIVAHEIPEEENVQPSPYQKNKALCYKITVITLKGSFCAIISAPGGVLNLFSALDIHFQDFKNTNDLKAALEKVSKGKIPNAVISGIAGEVMLTALNILYLGSALQKVKVTLGNIFGCHNISGKDVINILWSFTSAIAPAQLAKETFNFLGYWSYIPFTMQLLSAFATRVNGLDKLMSGILDDDVKFKKRVARDLLFASPIEKEFHIPVDMNNVNVSERINQALNDYVNYFYDDKKQLFINATHFKPNKAEERLYWLAKITGVPCTIFLGGAFGFVSIQKSVAGFESLLGIEIGKKNLYSNPISLIVGTLASLPSMSFNQRNGYDVPMDIITITRAFYTTFKDGKYFKFAGYMGLYILLTYLSYKSADGARGVARDLLRKGYLAYIGLTDKNAVGKFFVELLFWNYFIWAESSATRLVSEKLIMLPLEEITKIDHQTALMLLNYYSNHVNIDNLHEHDYFKKPEENRKDISCLQKTMFNCNCLFKRKPYVQQEDDIELQEVTVDRIEMKKN